MSNTTLPKVSTSSKIARTGKIALASLAFAAAVATAQMVLPPQSVSAQEFNQVEIVAIPPRAGDNGEIKLNPGDKKQVTLKVRNNSSRTMDIRSIVQDMLVGEDGSTPFPIDESISNRWGLASWVTVTPSTHSLKPKETAQLYALIEVPEDALPGGHYAMVTHEPDTGAGQELPEGVEEAQTGVSQRAGTLLYVTVDGPINEEAYIRDLAVPKFTEFGPVPMAFTIENRSDVHIHPQVGVEIYNIFGKKVDHIDVESKNIFPLTERSFASKWDRIWGFGPYKAKVIMSFGTEGNVAMASTMFWLLPIKLIFAGIICILSAVVIIIAIRRHIMHRNQDEQKKISELEQKVKDLEEKK